MRWMLDYDAAEKAGMAVRARLTQDLAAGLDFLLVLGIRDTLDRATDWRTEGWPNSSTRTTTPMG